MKKYIYLIIVSVVISACASKQPYTQSIQKKYKLTESDLKKIQFYTSADIILYKSKQDGSVKTEGGELVINKDKNVEKIIIKANTPGVVTEVIESDKIAVSFEVGDGKFLVFGVGNKNGYYYLQAKEWTKGKRGKLSYGGATWYASKGSGETYLLLKIKKLEKFQQSQKVIKGRKIE